MYKFNASSFFWGVVFCLVNVCYSNYFSIYIFWHWVEPHAIFWRCHTTLLLSIQTNKHPISKREFIRIHSGSHNKSISTGKFLRLMIELLLLSLVLAWLRLVSLSIHSLNPSFLRKLVIQVLLNMGRLQLDIWSRWLFVGFGVEHLFNDT